MNKLRSIPGLSYVCRTWPLLLAMLVFNFLTRWNHAFVWIPNGRDEWGNIVWQGLTLADLCGAFIYAPAGVALTFWLLGLFISLYVRTIENDVHSKRYEEDWNALTHIERVKYTVQQRLVYALIIGYIVAALTK